MELAKEKAKENLAKLIEKFEKEQFADRLSEYNEEATKTAFIQPLLKDVLGWDVNDRDEVSPEENVSRGRVDYGLKIEGRVKIFVEAKPIKADLSKHIEQAVRYGYNRKDVPFVLLTDFEGIKLFDVTIKPNLRNLAKGLKIDLHWNQYLENFDKLWLLSKVSVLNGTLDKLILIKPKEGLPVDKAILNDLERWRESLAKDIFNNNPKLLHSDNPEKDANYLKEITQKMLDRIIFMRSCEDRRLIHRHQLKELFEDRTEAVGLNTMAFLEEEFRNYNIIFDSDLFSPKEWEKNLAIDFKIMKDIILETYNPYQFDVIPIEVLGNIYEQYLGYTVKVTEHQVKYEEKPDVRKAGGVYYTPEYIVDYIVKNTVGKLLKELSPAKIKKLRILDPACGSGSFLIRAYEEMLNWYLNQKKEKKISAQEQEKLDLDDSTHKLRLTIQEKAKILREHIFGVDIDEQAVEVTKLSLMLKMLEGEYGIVAGRSLLPMLDKNIKCGNSLISGDILELKKYFSDEWYKVKPFNWDEQFRSIMVDEGGFDVVIGNPPWVFTRDVDFGEDAKKYYQSKYFASLSSIQVGKTRQSGKVNLYALFLMQGMRLLESKGIFGFIMPNNILRATVYDVVRKYILDGCRINQIVDLKSGVFERVTASTIILIFEKNSNNAKNQIIIIDNRSPNRIDAELMSTIPQSAFLKNASYAFSIFVSFFEDTLFEKMGMVSTSLGNLVTVYNGIATKKNKEGLYETCANTKCKKLLIGKDIHRYQFTFKNRYIEYDREKLHRAREESIFLAKEKLIMQRIGGILITTYDDNQYYTFNSVNNLIASKKCPYSLKFILGLLNSTLMKFYYICNFTNRSALTINISKTYLDELPICKIDFSNASEKEFYNNLVALVDAMLDLNKKIQSVQGNEKEQIQYLIEKTDKEIDKIVYELYGITEEERKIIEVKQ